MQLKLISTYSAKSLSQDLGKIKEVMEALKNSDVKFQVGFNRRFDHNFEAVRMPLKWSNGCVHIVKITQ